MKEEDIENRIERVTESVGSKIAFMRMWESERTTSVNQSELAAKRWRSYGISAAASVAVLCIVGLGIILNRDKKVDTGVASNTTLYRGGSYDLSEIQAMIDSANYTKALQAIETTMADTIIDPSFTADRKEYLRSLNSNREYELRWLKIEVLVKSGRKDNAITLLKDYVKSDGVHQKEAEDLLYKLTQ